ncbi:hypothetical protein [Maribacter sp. Asnod2-G09]|jgi:hypothetical protein|uniref:hypothetical protein n=1 Tax=Maribacter sp. Asnod2-G09 TaxID=3160577 RepID=UPI00386A5E48
MLSIVKEYIKRKRIRRIENTFVEFEILYKRENFAEIQVLRQSMLKEYISIEEPQHFAILLFFEKANKENKNYLKNFLDSDLSKNAKLEKIQNKDVYVIFENNNFSQLHYKVKNIQNLIFNHEKDNETEGFLVISN